MTISSLNINKVALLNNTNKLQEQSNGPVAAEQKLAVLAFQKIYEMMLQGEGSNLSSGMNSLFLTQFSSVDENTSSELLENSLTTIGNFNVNSRLNSTYPTPSNMSFNKDTGYEDIGTLSAKYESNGNPGVIANNPGDYGGKSYGAWQFSSKMGSLNSFVNSLEGKNSNYYSKLVQAKAADGNTYGSNFDSAWRVIAKEDKVGFLKLQHSYVKEAFYDKAAERLKNNNKFDINNKSTALKNVLWSTVVQHGVGGAVGIFSKLDLTADDNKIISQVYSERQKVNLHFRSSSSEIKKSVYNRFDKERNEALAMLQNEAYRV